MVGGPRGWKEGEAEDDVYRLANAVLGSQIDGAMTYTVFAINNKSRVRALDKDRDKRYQHMAEFEHDLERLLAGWGALDLPVEALCLSLAGDWLATRDLSQVDFRVTFLPGALKPGPFTLEVELVANGQLASSSATLTVAP